MRTAEVDRRDEEEEIGEDETKSVEYPEGGKDKLVSGENEKTWVYCNSFRNHFRKIFSDYKRLLKKAPLLTSIWMEYLLLHNSTETERFP